MKIRKDDLLTRTPISTPIDALRFWQVRSSSTVYPVEFAVKSYGMVHDSKTTKQNWKFLERQAHLLGLHVFSMNNLLGTKMERNLKDNQAVFVEFAAPVVDGTQWIAGFVCSILSIESPSGMPLIKPTLVPVSPAIGTKKAASLTPTNKVVHGRVSCKSSDKKNTWEQVIYEDKSVSCNCPSWTRKVDANGARYCKHLNNANVLDVIKNM